MPPKLCVDCCHVTRIHINGRDGFDTHACVLWTQATDISPVTGEKFYAINDVAQCHFEREAGGRCGPDGKFYIPVRDWHS